MVRSNRFGGGGGVNYIRLVVGGGSFYEEGFVVRGYGREIWEVKEKEVVLDICYVWRVVRVDYFFRFLYLILEGFGIVEF